MKGVFLYPDPPRGWAAVVPAQGASHRLSVCGLHWWLVCRCLQLLYQSPGLQAAICGVHQCGRLWTKDRLSPGFPGNSHSLPKPHSWSSGVGSQASMDMHRSLCNCFGHLKCEMCPNPKGCCGQWQGTGAHGAAVGQAGHLASWPRVQQQWFASWSAACHSKYFWSSVAFLSLLYLIFKKNQICKLWNQLAFFVVFFGEAVINGGVFSKITSVPC